jgi:hypothetical protein
VSAAVLVAGANDSDRDCLNPHAIA